jgi:alanine racemase
MIQLKGKRRTAALVDLGAIKQNILGIKAKVGGSIKICPVVKADAYGHGAVAVSKRIQEEKLADYLGISTVEEGRKLRRAGIRLPLLLLGLIMPDEAKQAAEHSLTITVCEKNLIDAASQAARDLNKKLKVQIKIDTGMGRIGCQPEETLDLATYVRSKKNLKLEGIFSHFPVSDIKDKTFSLHQIETFKKVSLELEKNGFHYLLKHLANSAAILNLPQSYFDMVRPGIMIYGHYPSDEICESIKIRPAMTLRSEIIFIKRVKKGTSLSYGRTYTTAKDSYIATVPAGYADGMNRLLSNNHEVIICGRLYPLVGRVTMDQILVDLGDDFHPVGTEVIIFGQEIVTASDVARTLNTIPYEVICAVSKMVKRYYIKEYKMEEI